MINQHENCTFDGGDCSKCVEELVGDGFCHAFNNIKACNFDGGDCMDIPKNCWTGLGDGICTENNNNALCHFDAGECCDGRLIPEISTMIFCPSCGCQNAGMI